MDTNLSRAECARRSADITLFGYRVELDVSEAVDPDQATFPTTSIIDLTIGGLASICSGSRSASCE